MTNGEDKEAMEETEDITLTHTVNMTTTDSGTENETGALASNDQCDPGHLHKVVQVHDSGTGDG